MDYTRPKPSALESVTRLVVAMLIAFPPSVWGNPNLGQVIAGAASISSSGNTLSVIQTSNNAIINWHGFSINQGELTQFLQPSAASAVLNRVTGGSPSSIYGTLQANGKVFLINPNGVMVGPTGVINTQSFIASTLDVDNAQFMAGGALVFAGSSLAGIINAGKINALGGDVLLIAHTVQNTGQIVAADGTAAMAAGSEVLFEPAGTERVFVQAGINDSAATGVDQKGQIQAATVELKAAGGNVYGLAINNSGIVRATGVSRVGGHVYLTAEGGTVVNSGQISATQGDQGGTVQVVGGDITLKSGSVIDVSGQNGGGTALIGGDSQGLNPDVPNASKTTVEAGATINADAVNSGNGGKVVVWSNDDTSFNGVISAKGGAVSGDAGSAEVSGGYLDFNGNVYLTAANGAMGTLLLDPYDLTISNSGDVNVSQSGNPTNSDSSNGNLSNLQDSVLVGQLKNANVTVQTSGTGTSQLGNITIAGSANLTWNTNNNNSGTLTLNANNNIAINAGATIDAQRNGSLILNANGGNGTITLGNSNITTSGGNQTYNGAVVLGANETLNSGGGAILFDKTVNGAQSLSLTNAGNVTFTQAVGNSTALSALSVAGNGNNNTTSLNGGAVTTTGAQTYGEAVTLGAANTALTTTNNSISFNNSVDSANGNAVSLTLAAGSGGISLGNVGNNNALATLAFNSNNTGVISLNGRVTTNNAQTYNQAIVLNGNSDSITTNGGLITLNGAVTAGGAGGENLALNPGNSGSVDINNTIGTAAKPIGTLSLNGSLTGAENLNGGTIYSGAETFNGPVVLDQSTTLNSNNGAVSFLSPVNAFSAGVQSLTLNEGTGGVSLVNVGVTAPLSSLAVNGSGGITLNGTIDTSLAQSYTQNITLAGNSALTTGGGAVTLSGSVNSSNSGPDSLAINGATSVSLGSVGTNRALSSLTLANSVTTLGLSGTVDTNSAQTYSQAIVLNGNSGLTTNNGAITLTNTATVNGSGPSGGQSLTINSGNSATTINAPIGGTKAVGALAISGSVVNLNAGTITSGAETYNAPVVVDQNTTLNTGNAGVSFNSSLDGQSNGGQSLIVNAGSGNINLGNVGNSHPFSSLTLNSGTLGLNGAVDTTGAQLYNQSITLNGDSSLNTTNNGPITINGTIDAGNGRNTSSFLTLSAGNGAVTLNGIIGGNNAIDGLSVVGTGVTNLNAAGTSNTPSITTNGNNTNDSLSFGENVVLGANTYITSQGQNVAFGGTVNGAHTLTIDNTGGGGRGGGGDGDATFSGAVGGVTPLTSLTIDASGGNGTINMNAGAVTTTGAQNYGEAVTLGKSTVLNSNGGGVTFQSTVDGLTSNTQSLTISAGSGGISFGDDVGGNKALLSLALSGTGITNFDGNGNNGNFVVTSGAQNYGEAVQLNNDMTLTSGGGGVLFSGTVDAGSGGGFFGNPSGLTIASGSGNITFNGAVGGTNALDSLALSGTGTTFINGGAVNTSANNGFGFGGATGDQTYGEAVVLGADTAITSGGGDVTFSNTVNGLQKLSIDTSNNGGGFFGGGNSGNVNFMKAVGNTAALTSLTIAANTGGGRNSQAGTTNLDGGAVTTSGTQTYGQAVVLGVSNLLTTTGSGGNILFQNTVDGTHNQTTNLTTNSAGNTTFQGAVGSNNTLTSLTATAGGTGINLDGGSSNSGVATTGNQDYKSPVTLGTDNVLSATGGNITFETTVDGAHNLTASANGVVTFDNIVGGINQLASLTTNGSGSTNINTTAVKTTGAQNFNATTLSQTATLTSSNSGAINFNSTLDAAANGAEGLTAATNGTTQFKGVVGALNKNLAFLTVANVGGKTNINTNSINTTGDQNYDATTLSQTATLTSSNSGAINFNSTLDAASNGAEGLTAATNGTTLFNGVVGAPNKNLSFLTVANVGGKTNINTTAINTTGSQNYDATTLSQTAALTSSNSGAINFNSTLDAAANGAEGLTAATNGTTLFNGVVGAPNKNLAFLTVANAGGKTNINTNSINTTGDQNYDATTLSQTATLTSANSGAINFNSTLDAAANGAEGLTAATNGTTQFKGVVGAPNKNLAFLTVANVGGKTNINTNSINTTGDQNYDATTLSQTATLTSSNSGAINFNSTLDAAANGAEGLTAATNGTTLFNGVVGAPNKTLSFLTVANVGGKTNINTNSINTIGSQNFNATTLSQTAALTSSNSGAINFNSTLDAAANGAEGLTAATNGTTLFNGVVGAPNKNLAFLTVANAGGKTNINTNSINTTGDQNYDATTLSQTATLTSANSGAINFNSTLDAAANGAEGLTAATNGTTSFNGIVGAPSKNLSFLTVANAGGKTNINTTAINTTGNQNYDATTLSQTAALTSSNNGTVNFNATLDASADQLEGLTATTGGAVSFDDKVGGNNQLAFLTSNGATNLNGGSVQTTGAQNYNGSTALNVDNTLTGSAVTFNGVVDGANNLIVNAANIGFNGAVGGQGTALTSLTSNGATSLDAGSVQTTGAQNYNGGTTLVVDNTLTGSAVNFNGTVNGPDNLTVTAANVGFNGAVGGQGTALTSLTSNGATSLDAGSVQTTGAQNYNGGTTLVVDNTLTGSAVNFNGTVDGANNLTVNAANIGFNGAVGGQGTALTSLTSNGATSLDAGSVQTTGAQNYNGGTTLVVDSILTGSAVNFNGTLNGPDNLTVNAANVGLNGAVGGLTSLTSNGATSLNAGSVLTTGAQNYNGNTTLVVDNILTGSAVNFNGAVDGASNLTVNAANVGFNGAVGAQGTALTSLTSNGATSLNGGSIQTTGAQNYNGNTTLVVDNALTGSALNFNGTVDGANNLTVTAANVGINGAVGGSAALASLTSNGATSLNGGSVQTTGAQNYNGATTLTVDNTLTGSAVNFNGTVDGADNLTVNAANIAFNGIVGGQTALASLTSNGAASLTGGAINTNGAQTYDQSVSLGAGTTLNSNGGAVTFNATVDGANDLTINAGAGNIYFYKMVGGVTPLSSLDIFAGAGTTDINGGGVYTNGPQTYGQNVILSADAYLSSHAGDPAGADLTGGDITFDGTVNGVASYAQNLTVDSGIGNITFVGDIGDIFPLLSLTLLGTGSKSINGAMNVGSLTTAGSLDYWNDLFLTSDLTLSVVDGNVTFHKRVNGPWGLSVTASSLQPNFGDIDFLGTVGDVAPLASLTVKGSGTTHIDGGLVATSGNQSYGEALALGADTTLTSAAGGVSFLNTVNGVQGLTVNTPNGVIDLNGGAVNTVGDQNYNGAAALSADAALTSSAGNIAFANTLGGNFGLTTNSALDTTFNGAVTIGSLGATAGNINLNNGSVTTAQDQTYNGAVALTPAASLTSTNGNIALNGAVTGANALTTNSALNTTFGGAVSVGSLDATANTINLANGSVTTAQDQTYNGAVALTPAASLTSTNGNIALNGAVTGANGLTTNSAQDTTFNGAVSVGSLDATAGGSINLNAGTIGTTGDQNYNTAVALTGNNSLTGNNITFANSLTGNFGLTLNSVANTNFNGVVNIGSLGATAGSINLNNGSVTTAQDQTYNGAVALTPAASLTSTNGNIVLNGAVTGANQLTTNSKIDTTFDGAVSVGSLDATAGGNINLNAGTIGTTGDQSYNTAVVLTGNNSLTGGNISFASTIGGANALTTNSALDTTLGGAVNIGSLDATAGGNINLNAGTIVTAGDQNYDTAVLLAGNNSLTGQNITFANTLAGNFGLTSNSAANTNFNGVVTIGSLGATANTINLNNGSVTTAQDQTYNGAVALTPAASLTSTNGNIVLNGSVTGANSLTTNSAQDTTFNGAVNVGSLDATATGGNINLNAGTIGTTGDQNYNTAAVLTGNDSLTGQNITFANTLTGNFGLTSNSVANTNFNGVVTIGSLGATANTINLNNGSVTTAQDQTYNGAVALTPAASLISTNGNIALNGPVTGANALTTKSALNTTFGGTVNVGSLDATANTINLANGSVTTAQDQTYNGAVALTPAASLTSTNGNIALNGTVAGANALTTNSGADTTFNGAVSVGALDATAGGNINLNAGTIGTTGDQNYNTAVVLTGNNSLTGQNITFANTLTGNFGLTSNSAANTNFNGVATIGSLDATASSINLNNGSVTTAQDQTYNGAVALTPAASLTATNGNIALNGPVIGANSLTTNSGADTSFNGAVTVGSLDATAGGKINLNGGTIGTTGDQAYHSGVIIGADASLVSSAGGVTFDKTINGLSAGLQSLAIDAQNDITLKDAVGDVTPLRSLTLDGAGGTGAIDLNGGAINTTAGQTYGQGVVLGANSVLNNNTGAVTFDKTLGGQFSLTINAGAGDIDFLGAVGDAAGLTSLTSLALTGTGTTDINGGFIYTSGAQTYGEKVVLSDDAWLGTNGALGSDVSFMKTVDGTVAGKQGLTVDGGAQGAITFYDSVGSVIPLSYLTLLGNGIHTLYGSVGTTGNQDYLNDLFLFNDLTLFSNNGNVTFHKRVDGGHILTVNAGTGDISFLGLVGSLTPLESLILNGTGITHLNGGSVATTGLQAYGEAVALGANTALTSSAGDVSFASTVDGAQSLTVNAITTDINGGAVTTAGSQTYGSAVSFGADTVLKSNGGDVTFDGTVTGAHDLTVDASAANSLDKSGNIAWNALISAVNLKLFGNDLIMRGAVSASGANGVLMSAAHSFQNLGSDKILLPGTGRWLIYSIDPTLDVDGGLTGSVQWSTPYQPGVSPSFAGNGFLYADAAPVAAPVIVNIGEINNGDNTGSGGSVTGVYDGSISEAGSDGATASNWSAAPSDIFSWDLGTMRDAVASPDEDPYGRKKKNKSKAKTKSPWFKEP